MKMRHKLILSLLATLAGLLAGLPLLIGLLLQWTAPRALAALDQPLDGFSVQLVSIERHWLSSEALLSIDSADGSTSLLYRTRIKHGPWPLDRPAWLSGQGHLQQQAAVMIEDQWRLSPWFDLHAVIRSHWRRADSGQSLDLALELETDRSLSSIRLDLLPSAVTLPGQFHCRALAGYAQFSKDRDDRWQLELRLNADSIGLGQEPRQLTGPTLAFTLSTGQGQIGATTTLTLDRLTVHPDHDYREGLASIALTGLDRATLANWWRELIAAHNSGLRGKYLLEKARGDLLLALPTLLAHRPSIEIETLHLTAAEGEASASARISLERAPPPGFVLDPQLLIEVAAATGSVQLPQALAQRWAVLKARAELGPGASPAIIAAASDQILLQLRANRLLLRDGNNYRLALGLSRGELSLNGQSMQLPSF